MTYRGAALRSTLGVAYRPRFDGQEVFIAANPLSILIKLW